MSFLARMVKGREASSPKDEERDRFEAVEKICNRLSYASLLEDRRSAAQALKSVSKQYQKEIGSLGWTCMVSALKRDFEDEELSKSLIETMITVLSFDEADQASVGLAEVMLKEGQAFAVIFNLLRDGGQSLRYDCLQLLSLFNEFLPRKLPASILSTTGALSTLIELIDDAHEVIRNEALLLLQRITKNNAEVQRVAAFEGCFERLFELIFSEGGVYGGEVLVEDALILIQNMLQYSPSNQKYFQESPCFPKLKLLLLLPSDDKNETIPSAQVTKNYVAAIAIVNLLLSRDSPKLETVQLALHKTGILHPLMNVAFNEGLPSSAMRRAAMISIGKLLYRNGHLQGAFSQLIYVDKARPVPAVLAAIKISVNDGEDLLGQAAVEMLGSFLQGNFDGQLVIAATFKSPSLESSPGSVDEQSAGSLIIDRVIDVSSRRKDCHKSLLASLLFSHILRGNEQAKMLALTHKVGDEEELLFNRILANLTEIVKEDSSPPSLINASVASLVLLCTWMDTFVPAIKMFLSEGSNIHFLMELFNQNSTVDPMIQGVAAFLFGLALLSNDDSQASFTKKTMEDIVRSRVGTDVFFARICRLRDRLLRAKAGLKEESNLAACDMAFVDLFLSKHEAILNVLTSVKPASINEAAHSTTKQDQSIETIDLQGDHHLYNGQRQASQPYAHEKNLESKCNYLVSENARLQTLVDAYSCQLIESEKDREELLMVLASQDSELKQLRQHLRIAEQPTEAASDNLDNSNVDLTNINAAEVGNAVPANVAEGEVGAEWLAAGALYATETQASSLDHAQESESVLPLLSPKKPATATHDV